MSKLWLCLNPLVMGLCFYLILVDNDFCYIGLNPLVMGLCFYLILVDNDFCYIGLNPLVMGLCFYQQVCISPFKVNELKMWFPTLLRFAKLNMD